MPNRLVVSWTAGRLFDFAYFVEKVKKGLSAGRVQSIALKLIIDREMKSMPSSQKNIGQLMVSLKRGTKQFQASFYGVDGKS